MANLKKPSFFLTLILLLDSCSNQRFILNKHHKLSKSPVHSEQTIFNNWGLGEQQVLNNPQRFCAKDQILSKIEFKQTRYPIEFITLGFLQPRTIDVYCINKELADLSDSSENKSSNSFLSKVDRKIQLTCKKEYKIMKKELPNLENEQFMHNCAIEKRKAFIELGL